MDLSVKAGQDGVPIVHVDFSLHRFVAVGRGEIACVLFTGGHLTISHETDRVHSIHLRVFIDAQCCLTPQPGKCSMRSLSTALNAAVAHSAKRITAITEYNLNEIGITVNGRGTETAFMQAFSLVSSPR